MRIRLAECLLMIASVLATCLAAEAIFCLVGLRYVPLRLHADLPKDVRVFAQSSKAGVLPRDPVVLLGDSYAQGYGDWLLSADPNGNGPFHSAHVINALIGRDVITLGQSGAGSVEAMALLPRLAYAGSQRAWYLRLPRPRVAVVYFYEGNDLDNNIQFLASRVRDLDAPGLAERIDGVIAAYVSAAAVDARWRRHFPFSLFSANLARHFVTEGLFGRPQPAVEADPPLAAPDADQRNAAEVAGRAVSLPASLQSPAMDLTPEELNRAALVFERSLAFLRDLLPDSPVLVAYLPSPLSTYRLLSPQVSIQRYVKDRATRYPAQEVMENSDRMCRLIRTGTIVHGAGFLDLRAAFRAAGLREMLHGPADFKHYNRKGMELLGRLVAGRIDTPIMQEQCTQGAG